MHCSLAALTHAVLLLLLTYLQISSLMSSNFTYDMALWSRQDRQKLQHAWHRIVSTGVFWHHNEPEITTTLIYEHSVVSQYVSQSLVRNVKTKVMDKFKWPWSLPWPNNLLVAATRSTHGLLTWWPTNGGIFKAVHQLNQSTDMGMSNLLDPIFVASRKWAGFCTRVPFNSVQ